MWYGCTAKPVGEVDDRGRRVPSSDLLFSCLGRSGGYTHSMWTLATYFTDVNQRFIQRGCVHTNGTKLLKGSRGRRYWRRKHEALQERKLKDSHTK